MFSERSTNERIKTFKGIKGRLSYIHTDDLILLISKHRKELLVCTYPPFLFLFLKQISRWLRDSMFSDLLLSAALDVLRSLPSLVTTTKLYINSTKKFIFPSPTTQHDFDLIAFYDVTKGVRGWEDATLTAIRGTTSLLAIIDQPINFMSE